MSLNGSVNVPRAVRNCNPGNIRKGAPWQGLSDVQDDPDFCTFSSPKWGFRAMGILLVTYQDRYRLGTVRQLIGRWAPPSENQTGAYVGDVARLTNFEPDEQLDMHNYEDLKPVVKAIATHESGKWLFTDIELEAGLRAAGIEPKEPSFVATRGVPPKIAALGTVGAGTTLEILHDARDQLSEYSYALAWAPKVLFGLTAVIIIWELWKHYGWKKAGLR